MEPNPNSTPGATSGNSPQPAPGQVSRLASSLAAKQGAKPRLSEAKVLPPRPGSKGGRLSVAEESAAFLQKNGLVAVPLDAASSAGVAPVQPIGYVVTPEFVGEVSEKLLQGVESWRVRQVALRVQTLCGDKSLAKEFADSASAPPGCIATVSKSMMEIARKYPAILQWAPELAGLAALGTWFAKDAQINRKLDELEGRMIKQAERASAPPRNVTSPHLTQADRTIPDPAKPAYAFEPTANPKP